MIKYCSQKYCNSCNVWDNSKLPVGSEKYANAKIKRVANPKSYISCRTSSSVEITEIFIIFDGGDIEEK